MNHQPKLVASLYLLAANFLLSSCFVFKTNIDWRHTYRRTTLPQDSVVKPEISVSLKKKPHFIILPFVMVLYTTKGYATNFNLATGKDFGKIDSVSFSLHTEGGDLIFASESKPNVHYSNYRANKFGKTITSTPAELYWGNFDLRMPGVVINRKDELLIMNYKVFTSIQPGKVRIYSCDSCKLKREGMRFGSFH